MNKAVPQNRVNRWHSRSWTAADVGFPGKQKYSHKPRRLRKENKICMQRKARHIMLRAESPYCLMGGGHKALRNWKWMGYRCQGNWNTISSFKGVWWCLTHSYNECLQRPRKSIWLLWKKLCMNCMKPPKTEAFCLKNVNAFWQKSQGGRENLPPHLEVGCFGGYLGRPV